MDPGKGSLKASLEGGRKSEQANAQHNLRSCFEREKKNHHHQGAALARAPPSPWIYIREHVCCGPCDNPAPFVTFRTESTLRMQALGPKAGLDCKGTSLPASLPARRAGLVVEAPRGLRGL